MDLGVVLAIVLPLVAIQLTLIVLALRDLLRPERRVQGDNKLAWGVVICVFGLIGPLAYFWVGSANGVELQLWATWLLYAVLVDLTDAVADALNQPLAALSLEMVYRSLYYLCTDQRPDQPKEVVAYLAAQDDLGLVKRQRKRKELTLDNRPATLNL